MKVKIRIQIPRKLHVASVSDSDTSIETSVAGSSSQPVVEAGAIDATDKPAAAPAAATAVTETKWYRLRQDGYALVKYLLDSEVHTFAFSVAANAILSFIPCIVLLYTIAPSVFHSNSLA